jgi:hypothetical protein
MDDGGVWMKVQLLPVYSRLAEEKDASSGKNKR